MKKLNLDRKDFFSILIIQAAIIILEWIGIYGNPFFSDPTIMFNGGYYIAKGLIPFVDFALPPMPISFLIQGLSQLLIGSNQMAMALHVIILSSVLSIFFFIIVRKYFSRPFSIFLAVALFYSYNGLIAFPWYNTTAIFFFILNVLIIFWNLNSDEKMKNILVVSAILTVLGIFSKTDIGAIHFVTITLYFLYAYRARIKSIFLQYIFPTIGASIVINKIISYLGDPIKFRLTSEIVKNRIHDLFSPYLVDSIIYSFNFYVLIFCVYFIIKERVSLRNHRDPKNRIILLLLITTAFVFLVELCTQQKIQTKITALPLILFFVYVILVKQNYNLHNFSFKHIKLVSVFIIFLLIFTQLSILGNYHIPYYKSTPQQVKYILLGTDNFIKEGSGCFKGKLFYKEEYPQLRAMREYIEENDESFLATGVYQFLYCDYDKLPPKELPLWFHEKVTMTSDDVKYIVKYVDDSKPKIVFEHMGFFSRESQESFWEELEKIDYVKIDELENMWNHNISVFQYKG